MATEKPTLTIEAELIVEAVKPVTKRSCRRRGR